MRVTIYFKDSIKKDTDDKNRMFKAIKSKSWTPDKNYHTIDAFAEAVKKDIEYTKTFNPKQTHTNLSKGEREAIKELTKRKDIVATNAD